MATVDYYALIDVAPDATGDDIRAAIREQRRLWSRRAALADRTARTAAESRIELLSAAERVLLDAASRREFDVARSRPSGSAAAREALRAGDLAETARQAAVALRADPGDADARFLLGAVLNAAGRFAEALPHLQAASRLRSDTRTRAALARALLGVERRAEALELLESVVRDEPTRRLHQYWLAVALREVARGELSRRADGSAVITSPAQIVVVREMCGRARGLDSDDPELQAALDADLASADAAEQPAWSWRRLPRRGPRWRHNAADPLVIEKGL